VGSDRPVAEAALADRTAEDRRAAEVQVIEALPEPWWSARRRATRDPVVVAARLGHGTSLVVAAPLILWFNRNQWFFGDEWEFFANRMSGWGRVLFEPHNEHWSTAPILAYRAVYAAVGLRSYLPYVAVLVVLHVTAAHLLWRVMNRVGVAPLVSTGLAAVFAVLGSGYENLLWAFQIGFVGSVAVGLAHLLLVDHDGPFGRRDRLAWVVAVVGLLFSGISVIMTVTSGVSVLLRRGVKDALATVAPPAAVYVLWFAAVGHEGLGSGGGRAESVLDAPAYLWTGLSSALEGASGIPAAGAVLVILVLGWLLRHGAATRLPSAPATAMAVGAASLFAMLAAGRSGYGVEQATASRYLYIAVALLLPALGLMLSDATGRVVSRQVAALIVLAPVLLHNVASFRELSHAEADRERAIRTTVLAAAALADDGAPLAATQPEPRFSPDVTVDLLRRLDRQGALPDEALAEVDVLTAAGQLQVALRPDPPPDTGNQPTVSTAINDRGCLLIGPSGASPVDVRFAAPGAIALRTPTGGDVAVALHSATSPGVTGTPRTMTLRPDVAVWLHVAAPTTVTVSSPAPAATEVCGVRIG
jgi:hypothetical protein